MILPKQWPECDRKDVCFAACVGGSSSALVSYGSLVDRDGNIIKPPATKPKHVWSFTCVTCGQSWSEEA